MILVQQEQPVIYHINHFYSSRHDTFQQTEMVLRTEERYP